MNTTNTPANTKSPEAVPQLNIRPVAGSPLRCELEGWKELNRWGMLNHPQWHQLQRHLETAGGLSEVDKLRFLAGELLRTNVRLVELCVESARKLHPPMLVIPDNHHQSNT